MRKTGIGCLAALAALLSGCAADTAQQSTSAKPQTADHALIAAAGLNIDQAQSKVSRTGLNNITDTGLAVGMTQQFGVGGLAAGVMGVLANGGPGLEGQTLIIAQLPRGAASQAYEKRLSESLYRTSGLDLEAQGYIRATDPKFPSAATFIQPGCKLTRHGYYDPKCKKMFNAHLQQSEGSTSSGTAHRVTISYGGYDADLAKIGRQLADMHPKEVSLYLPPERVAGGISKPKIYRSGQEITLD